MLTDAQRAIVRMRDTTERVEATLTGRERELLRILVGIDRAIDEARTSRRWQRGIADIWEYVRGDEAPDWLREYVRAANGHDLPLDAASAD